MKIPFTPADIPDQLPDLLGFETACGCGRVHGVDLRGAVIREGAVEEVVAWAREVGRGLRVRLVADRITLDLAGERVARLLRADGHKVGECLLPDGAGGRPHADEGSLKIAEEALREADLGVAVGAGTVNDVTKLATFQCKIPYLVVPTAPSMNGYTSAIAAVMIQGIKRTVDCHQPLAVLADLDLLRDAPQELIAAGLGDLESKPTATADYRLAGRIRGDYYCPAPEQVVMKAEARMAAAAAGLKERDGTSLRLLTEALLLSGLSMKLAGSSSPASGGEHLISHHWDMTAGEEGRVEGWHGSQVGVATIVTATLYEHLRRLRPDDIDVESLVRTCPPRADLEASIRRDHPANADEVVAEFFKKHLDKEAYARELRAIRDGWGELWDGLGDVLRPGARVREILQSAGAPTTVKHLGLTPDHLRRSLRVALRIRGRYTVLDFAAGLGVLDILAGPVLQDSGCLAD